jgi:hypothetical protein
MKWLRPGLKARFMVAGQIGGFHPKAIFWKEASGSAFAIIGSSNLTAAAFQTNHEANVYSPLSSSDYQAAKQWVNAIARRSMPISNEWLESYKEAPLIGGAAIGEHDYDKPGNVAMVQLSLPRPNDMDTQIDHRRLTLGEYNRNQPGLMRLFRDCAAGRVTSAEFYELLPSHWGGDVGGRLQGRGWERSGSGSDFRLLSQSFLRIVNARADERDDVAVLEIDQLASHRVPTRRAFLSEMLCLRFPEEFPVINKPVQNYLQAVGFKPPSGTSEGDQYMYLAQTLRVSLQQNPTHPAKNLAELDIVIWMSYQ